MAGRTMPDLVYRPAALADLDAIYDHIAADNPRRAFTYVQDIRERCKLLETHPRLGPAREDLGIGVRIYTMLHRVVVAYRITENSISIIRVFYGGRDYAALMRAEDDAEPSDTA